jgi:site-specific recombinase XerC
VAPGNQPRQRPHKPNELGPRVYFRGRWAGADLRPWGGDRCTLRNPDAFGWPNHGDRTDDPEVADRWKWRYVDYLRDGTKRLQLKLGPRPQSLADRAADFLEHRKRVVGESTYAGDRSALEAHLLPMLGETRRITTIRQADMQAVADALLDKGYQLASVTRWLSAWSVFFGWCGFGPHNPARGIVLPDPVVSDARAWDDDEIAELRRVADVLDQSPIAYRENRIVSMRVALELGLNTGGRQAELVALDWRRFQFADRTVRFTMQVTRDRRGLKPLKGKEARTALVLPDWWPFHRATAKGRIIQWHNEAADLSTMYLQLMLLYDTAQLNGPGLGWHTLRHTYSRLFLELGGRLEELQKSLGHKSIRTTERSYTHFSPETAATLARARIYGSLSTRVVRHRA